jgi:sialic acid synthase SpsE
MKNSRLYEKAPYLIAECAYSHVGDRDYLKKSIKKIAAAGCIDAVKFHVLFDIQTYMCPDHDLYEKVQEWLFSEDEWRSIIDHAISLNLDVIILADDLGCLDFLESVQNTLSAIEIHACSLNDIKMLNKVSDFSIPVILGIGGSTIDEIAFAIDCLKEKGKSDIILMYGFQNYPTKYEYINLKKMQKMKELFDLPIGYADHTSWNDENQELITLAGFVCGASLIEKHFVLEKGKNRIDYEAAIAVEDFSSLYKKLDILQKAMGDGRIELNKYEKEYGKIGPIKKAIVADKDVDKDEEISLQNIAFKRTNKISNIKQKEVQNLLKRKAKGKIIKNELITFENTYPSEDRK